MLPSCNKSRCSMRIRYMGHCTLTLAFLSPGPEDHWVNRLTAHVGKHPYCHVELYFESINQCFSIMWSEIASFRSKNLSNPNYRLVSLDVSSKEYELCLEFCMQASRESLVFDEVGMWASWVCCPVCELQSIHKGRTFCSKIITEALQYAGIQEVDRLSPSRTSPSSLYECVRQTSRMVCNSVPFKRHALIVHSQM